MPLRPVDASVITANNLPNVGWLRSDMGARLLIQTQFEFELSCCRANLRPIDLRLSCFQRTTIVVGRSPATSRIYRGGICPSRDRGLAVKKSILVVEDEALIAQSVATSIPLAAPRTRSLLAWVPSVLSSPRRFRLADGCQPARYLAGGSKWARAARSSMRSPMAAASYPHLGSRNRELSWFAGPTTLYREHVAQRARRRRRRELTSSGAISLAAASDQNALPSSARANGIQRAQALAGPRRFSANSARDRPGQQCGNEASRVTRPSGNPNCL